jgi:predicted nucleic acid-binding protein
VAVLVDTNVLVFAILEGHPWREEARQAIHTLLASGEQVCVLPQNIAEFWNVCTRPLDRNGLGLTPGDAGKLLGDLDPILTVLYDTPATYMRWRSLLIHHNVRGVQAHDARIVAAMQIHGIRRLITYNPRDFNRYEGITSVKPPLKPDF